MTIETMHITVRFFAAPREALGRAEVEISVPVGITVEVLLEQLEQQYPVLDAYIRSLNVAVNRTYADRATVLRDGDEVACLPPVGGG